LTQLGRRWHIAVRTFRKNGEGVDTPVWCVADGGRLLVMTSSRSGKVKRIAHTPRVEVCASDMRGRPRGPWLVGEAQLVSDPGEIELAVRGLRHKYGLLFTLFSRLNGGSLGYGDRGRVPLVGSHSRPTHQQAAAISWSRGGPEHLLDLGHALLAFLISRRSARALEQVAIASLDAADLVHCLTCRQGLGRLNEAQVPPAT
jgi:PPOX class probable F420-dependent enzyme